MRPADLADQFDEIIMGQVAMVFDVDPMSLGIIPQVSTAVSPFAAKEMAQASRVVHERTSHEAAAEVPRCPFPRPSCTGSAARTT